MRLQRNRFEDGQLKYTSLWIGPCFLNWTPGFKTILFKPISNEWHYKRTVGNNDKR